MSELGWTVYLIDIFSKISTVASVITIVSGIIAGGVLFAMWMNATDDIPTDKTIKKTAKISIVTAISFGLIYTIAPNRTTCYQIFAVNTAVELYQNSEALQQLPEKSLNAFNRILDSICEEEKNDFKDESR